MPAPSDAAIFRMDTAARPSASASAIAAAAAASSPRPITHPVKATRAWSAALLALFMPLAVRAFSTHGR